MRRGDTADNCIIIEFDNPLPMKPTKLVLQAGALRKVITEFPEPLTSLMVSFDRKETKKLSNVTKCYAAVYWFENGVEKKKTFDGSLEIQTDDEVVKDEQTRC
jgi:hypothetical protein